MTKTPFSTTSKWSRFLLAALLSSALVGCGGIGDDPIPPLTEEEKQQVADETADDETVDEEPSDSTGDDTTPLYMVGDATPGGWALDAKTELALQADSTTVYFWEGDLTMGQLKFAHYEATDFCGGAWLLANTAGEAPNLDGSGNGYTRSEDCPEESADLKWQVEQDGTYQITVNTDEQMVYFNLLDGAEPEPTPEYYSNLYLVGDAAPGGWTLDAAAELTVDANNPALFTWSGALSSGELKIATQNAEYGGGHDWLHPVEAGASLTGNNYAVVAADDGATDYKWSVTEADDYRVRVDLESETIHFGAPYFNLFLVGSATPGGWDLASATKMERDAADVHVYHATVDLTAGGEFKIATGLSASSLTFDAGEDWIHPNTDGQPLSESAFSIVTAGDGSTDYKWQVSEADAGTYDITLDLQASTIVMTRQ